MNNSVLIPLIIFGSILTIITMSFVLNFKPTQRKKEYLSQAEKVKRRLGKEIKIENNSCFGFYRKEDEIIVEFSFEDIDKNSCFVEIPLRRFRRIKPTDIDGLITINLNLELPYDIYEYSGFLDKEPDLSFMSTTEIVKKYSKIVIISMSDGKFDEFLSMARSIGLNK